MKTPQQEAVDRYQEKNKEKLKQYRKEYRKKNRDKINAKNREDRWLAKEMRRWNAEFGTHITIQEMRKSMRDRILS